MRFFMSQLTNSLINRVDKNLENNLTSNIASDEFSSIYEVYKKKFSQKKTPIEVDFRELVDFRSGIDRYSHLIHPYPAKLLLNIPFFFLNNKSIIKEKGVVLDPFCGSGTVLLESILAGHDTLGVDANPLARLISKVKCTPLDIEQLSQKLEDILINASCVDMHYKPQKVVDWNYWYPQSIQKQLKNLIGSINTYTDNEYKNFFQVCFSLVVRKLSYADPNVSVPVKINPNRFDKLKKKKAEIFLEKLNERNVLDYFSSLSRVNISKIDKLKRGGNLGNLIDLYLDAKNYSFLNKNSVDLIITSPPYAGAQKYIRSSSLSLGWLKLCPNEKLRNLERENIGREHYPKSEYKTLIEVPVKKAQLVLKKVHSINPLRAHIAGNYLVEMYEALQECYRVLKPGKKMILIVGNNVVCGQEFETYIYLKEICKQIGFGVEVEMKDLINSRGLMTKRNKTASVITCEWIIVLVK